MNQTRPHRYRMTIFAILCFVCIVGPTVNATAQEAPTTDMGHVPDGAVVWTTDGRTFFTIPGVPCEVCTSRATIEQAAQDANEADRLRRDLRAALFRVELKEEALTESRASRRAALERVQELENRPGFWSGAAVGAGIVVVGVLVLVLSVR